MNVLDVFDTKKHSTAYFVLMFKRDQIVYVAEENEKIIGIIRGSENKIISLMVEGHLLLCQNMIFFKT